MTHSCTTPQPEPVITPVDILLEGESVLDTPVAAFARTKSTLSQATDYHQLLPLSTPGAGEQYAFRVDLDSCFGCKACVTACHSLNGLDEEESWRDVGFIQNDQPGVTYHQTITSACHHCADPGCLNGCPVEAYEKDPITGIVVHLDDQCIGCSYCILKCPYDVPKFNKRLGIVRKCDMCQGRLAEGEAPACAQACPTHAISVTIINTRETMKKAAQQRFLPGAPSPDYTIPTTQYTSKRPIPDTSSAGDAKIQVKQHAHWPLLWMLVLTQLSVGLCLADFFTGHGSTPLLVGAAVLAMAGIFSSVLHLGQPLRAWRVFLGLRTSWLSREIIVFGAYLGLSGALVIAHFMGLPIAALGITTAIMGMVGVLTSVMIYSDTRRQAWGTKINLWRFYGTTGLGLLLGVAIASGNKTHLTALALLFLGKRSLEWLELSSIEGSGKKSPNRYDVLTHPEKRILAMHVLAFVGLLGSITLFPMGWGLYASVFAAVFMSEVIERYFFFITVDVMKMPGGSVA